MNKSESESFDSIFWHKGEGMSRRNNNIEAIKNLIAKGLSYPDIARIARRFFTTKTFNEYYEIALDEVQHSLEEPQESFIEQVKSGKIKPRKDVPDS